MLDILEVSVTPARPLVGLQIVQRDYIYLGSFQVGALPAGVACVKFNS